MSDVFPSGVFEIRVHGVSGTSPASTLGVPNVVQTAGDRRAGFFRAGGPDGNPLPRDGQGVVEAYSWGNLTSGGRLRALWLLLAPFTIANVAVFSAAAPLAVPPERFPPHRTAGRQPADARAGDDPGTRVPRIPDPNPGPDWRRTRRVLEAALRLLALLLTVTLVLAPVSVAMDIIGWQYRAQYTTGEPRPAWLWFLDWSWLQARERAYAASAVVPLLFVVLLWVLANRTWAGLEQVPVPAASPAGVATPLEDRGMWNSARPVQLLRALHITVGLAFVAGYLLLPLWFSAGASPLGLRAVWGGAAGRQVVLATCLVSALLAAVVALVAGWPTLSDRARPDPAGEPGTARADRIVVALPWVALSLLAWATAIVWWSGDRPVWHGATVAGTPGAVALVNWVLGLQIALLLVVAAASALLRWGAARAWFPHLTGDGDPAHVVSTTPAWAGLMPAGLGLLGCLLATAWLAGLAFAVAQVLGSADVSGPGAAPEGVRIVLPPAWSWVALVALVAIVAGLVSALAVAALVRRSARVALVDVRNTYGEPPSTVPAASATGRQREIARVWARARMDSWVRPVVGAWMLTVALTSVAGVVLTAVQPLWVSEHALAAVNWGTFALVGLAGLMLWVGRGMYRDSSFRRKIGILWDLGTFWPRAVHPLAPPCYMERTVPDLLTRLRAGPAEQAEHVVLSCHSQGTVIGAAVLLQLDVDAEHPIGLLTYGSPLRRLYSCFFPAYFGRAALGRLGQFLDAQRPWTKDVEFDDGLPGRVTWRWRNLWRSSDPIGGPVFADHHGRQEAADDVDWWLPDPESAYAPVSGDTCWPAIRGHSGYQATEHYRRALRAVTVQPSPVPPAQDVLEIVLPSEQPARRQGR